MWATAVRGQTVRFWFILTDTDGAAITGATLPVRVIAEGAPTVALSTGNASQGDSANMPGWYYYDYTVAADEAYGNILARANAASISGASTQTLGSGYYVSQQLAYMDTALSTLATASALSTLAGEVTALSATAADIFNYIEARLPATLSSGRVRAQVEGMGANVLTASALAADAVNEIADQNWRELLADHTSVANSMAQYINSIWDWLFLYIRPQTDKLQFAADNDLKVTLDGEAVTVTGAPNIHVRSAVTKTGNIADLVIGDSYTTAKGRSLSWRSADWLSYALDDAACTVTLRIRSVDKDEAIVETTCAVSSVMSGTQIQLTAELTAAQTAKLHPGVRLYRFEVEAVWLDGNDDPTADSPVTLVSSFIEEVLPSLA